MRKISLSAVAVLLLGTASFLASPAEALRIAFLTDIHLDPAYNEGCQFIMCLDKGNYALDAPQNLLDTVLDDMSLSYHDKKADVNSTEKIDAIIVTGDFVVHGLSSKNFSENNWEKSKVILQKSFDSITTRFPGVPVINAIGNNDAIHHYQAPNGTFKDVFYGDLYDMWFKNYLPNQNANSTNAKNIEKTFK